MPFRNSVPFDYTQVPVTTVPPVENVDYFRWRGVANVPTELPVTLSSFAGYSVRALKACWVPTSTSTWTVTSSTIGFVNPNLTAASTTEFSISMEVYFPSPMTFTTRPTFFVGGNSTALYRLRVSPSNTTGSQLGRLEFFALSTRILLWDETVAQDTIQPGWSTVEYRATRAVPSNSFTTHSLLWNGVEKATSSTSVDYMSSILAKEVMWGDSAATPTASDGPAIANVQIGFS